MSSNKSLLTSSSNKKAALAHFPAGQSATFYTHRTGENMRTASRSSNSRWTPRTHKTPGKTSAGQAVRRLALMGRAVSEDCQAASAALLHPVNPLPFITRFARLNKQRSGDFRLFPPANFANSAILPTDKISAFFMQNFLLQKPKDSSWSMPLLSPQGKNDRLRYRSAEWTLSTPWPERFQLRWHLRMRSEM